jgi:predicted DNA-binding protein (MmcQ/YjbR family)
MPPSIRELRSQLLAHALSLPGAWEDHPWGESVAKVGAKVFVFFGVPDPQHEQTIVCVKLPRSGVRALDLGFTEPAGYGLGKSGWVVARIGEHDRPDHALLRSWIEESYRAVALRKLVAELDGAPAPAPPRAPQRKSARATKPRAKAAARKTKRRS